MSSCLQRRFVLCSFAALALVAPAAAQGRARMGRILSGKKVYNPRVLTPEALKTCLGLESQLDGYDDELANMSAQITLTKQTISTREGEIDAGRSALTSPEAIKRHNDLVDEHNSAQAQLRTQIEAYNAKIDVSEKAAEDFNHGCASKDYYADDLAAVRKALGK